MTDRLGMAAGALVLYATPMFTTLARLRQAALCIEGFAEPFYLIEMEHGPNVYCLGNVLWDLSIVQDRPRCHIVTTIGGA